MPLRSSGRFEVDYQSVAEVLFLLVLVWMIAGPLSGLVLSIQERLAAFFVTGANKVESTKNTAARLIIASNRVKALEQRLADAQLELARLHEQSDDIDQLRLLLGLRKQLARQSIAADVITHNPDNWFERITIDKGTLDHVVTGSAVITPQGVVGQVVSVTSNAAVVRLVSDPTQTLGVTIKRLNQPGVLVGKNRSPAAIEYVPVAAQVDVGDRIVALGNGGIFPSGQPVGTVCAVRRDVNGTTLSIDVKLSESLYDLRQVLVIPPSGG